MSDTTTDIVIRSSSRSSGTSNNFVIQLGASIPMTGKKMELNKVIMPWMYYNVNSTNNTIIVRDAGTSLPATATVTPGNYTPAEIATALQTAMNAQLPLNTWTVVYNPNTFFFTITKSLAVAYDVLLGGSILPVIGVSLASGATIPVTTPVVSNVAPTFGWLPQVFIQVNPLASTHFICQSPTVSATFCIDTIATAGTILLFEPDPHRQEISGFGDNSISTLQISIVDASGNLVSIQNADWVLVLRLK